MIIEYKVIIYDPEATGIIESKSETYNTYEEAKQAAFLHKLSVNHGYQINIYKWEKDEKQPDDIMRHILRSHDKWTRNTIKHTLLDTI